MADSAEQGSLRGLTEIALSLQPNQAAFPDISMPVHSSSEQHNGAKDDGTPLGGLDVGTQFGLSSMPPDCLSSPITLSSVVLTASSRDFQSFDSTPSNSPSLGPQALDINPCSPVEQLAVDVGPLMICIAVT